MDDRDRRESATHDVWEPLADRFVAHHRSLRGAVRRHVIHQHLVEHLPPAPLEIVDIGAGAGNQSVLLARGGHRVTMVDPSPAMLAEAERLVASETPEVRGRMTLVRADAVEAPDRLDRAFDAVLCHGVLLYLDDPGPAVDALCALVRPGGMVSIVTKNADTLAVLPALQGDWKAALDAFDTDRQVNRLGLDTRGDTVEGLSAALTERELEPLTWYGVRLFVDGWADDDDSGDEDDPPSADLLAVELEASGRDPYRRLSRLFHLIARKPLA